MIAETAGGVVISGLKRLVEAGRIGRDDVTVAFITGAGLKTQEAVSGTLEPPIHVEPALAAFEEALGERQAIGAQAAS